MSTTDQNELLLTRPAWQVLTSSLRPLVFVAATVAYGVAVGATGVRLVLLAAFLLLAFGWLTVASVLSGVAAVTGQAPAITPAGLRVRLRPWHRRTVTIGWPQLDAVWIGYLGRRAYLCIRARSVKMPANGTPLATYLPPKTDPDTVGAALAHLSDGAATLWNQDPDQPGPGTGGRRRVRFADHPRTATATAAVLLLTTLVWLLGVPAALSLPEPWHQPWWP